jgi:hypothetical protein
MHRLRAQADAEVVHVPEGDYEYFVYRHHMVELVAMRYEQHVINAVRGSELDPAGIARRHAFVVVSPQPYDPSFQRLGSQ